MGIVLPNKKDLSEEGDFVVLETRKSFENAPKSHSAKKSKSAKELLDECFKAYKARENYERSLEPGPLTKEVVNHRRELTQSLRKAEETLAEKLGVEDYRISRLVTESMAKSPKMFLPSLKELLDLVRAVDGSASRSLAQRIDDIIYKINPSDYNKSFASRADGLKVAEDALKTREGRKAVIEELESYLKPGNEDNDDILAIRNNVMDLQYKNTPRPPKIGYKMPTQSQLNRGFRR